jgi:hypothetical protein
MANPLSTNEEVAKLPEIKQTFSFQLSNLFKITNQMASKTRMCDLGLKVHN